MYGYAFVRGERISDTDVELTEEITYNPFEYSQFVHRDTERGVATSEVCHVSTDGVLANGIEFVTDI